LLDVRIVSGGQTGVDRAALDAARTLGLEHGGWCPLGRIAEDGPIPAEYNLIETDSPEYPVRTKRNVIDSEGTLILYRHRLTGGTKLTHRFTRRRDKPSHLQDLAKSLDVEPARQWIAENRILVLNVAGPRESSAPGIQQQSYEFLIRLFADV
jgi:hypothetical protein